MLRKVFVGAALAFCVLSGAQAGIVVATYNGTISSGFDGIGVWGARDSDLAGLNFKLVYTIDDTVPADQTLVPGVYSSIAGGAEYGYPASPVSADLTINGITIHINGTDLGHTERSTPLYGSSYDVYSFAQDYWSSGSQYSETSVVTEVYSKTDPLFTDVDYHSPVSHTMQPGDNFFGAAMGGYYNSPQDNRNWRATLALTSFDIVSLGTPASVPEPGTLALFGAGLLGAGVFGTIRLRRRKQSR